MAFLVLRCRLLGPSDSSILGGSRVGVLVHIGNASEMNWIGHYVRRRRGDRDGEGTDGARWCPADHLCQLCHCWLATLLTLSAHRGQPRSQCFARAPQFATGRRHEQLPPFGGSGGLNAGAPFAGSCDILSSHLFVKTMCTPLKKAL